MGIGCPVEESTPTQRVGWESYRGLGFVKAILEAPFQIRDLTLHFARDDRVDKAGTARHSHELVVSRDINRESRELHESVSRDCERLYQPVDSQRQSIRHPRDNMDDVERNTPAGSRNLAQPNVY